MRLLVLLALTLLITTSCGVYRSQGRRSFETDTPNRVRIALVFRCPNSTLVAWDDLKAVPGLSLTENIHGKTVQLLASTPRSGQFCISESLDLASYMENREFLASHLNTWP